jgi:hypothetical protein
MEEARGGSMIWVLIVVGMPSSGYGGSAIGFSQEFNNRNRCLIVLDEIKPMFKYKNVKVMCKQKGLKK